MARSKKIGMMFKISLNDVKKREGDYEENLDAAMVQARKDMKQSVDRFLFSHQYKLAQEDWQEYEEHDPSQEETFMVIRFSGRTEGEGYQPGGYHEEN